MAPPTADKRKYAHLASHRDYTIATYRQDTPIYLVGDVPVFVVYYVLDEMGEPLLPIDLPVWSPHVAFALIDTYISLNTEERNGWHREQGPWRLLHQLYRMQAFLPGVAEALRKVFIECSDDDLDVFYNDAADFGAHLLKSLAPVIAAIDSAGPVPKHMQTTYGELP